MISWRLDDYSERLLPASPGRCLPHFHFKVMSHHFRIRAWLQIVLWDIVIRRCLLAWVCFSSAIYLFRFMFLSASWHPLGFIPLWPLWLKGWQHPGHFQGDAVNIIARSHPWSPPLLSAGGAEAQPSLITLKSHTLTQIMHAFLAAVFYLGVSHLAALLSLLLFSKKPPKQLFVTNTGRCTSRAKRWFDLALVGSSFIMRSWEQGPYVSVSMATNQAVGCQTQRGEHLWWCHWAGRHLDGALWPAGCLTFLSVVGAQVLPVDSL